MGLAAEWDLRTDLHNILLSFVAAVASGAMPFATAAS